MKTYLPTLLKILHHVCKYIGRYRDTIVDVIGEEHAPALDAIVTACNVFTAIANDFIPPPE